MAVASFRVVGRIALGLLVAVGSMGCKPSGQSITKTKSATAALPLGTWVSQDDKGSSVSMTFDEGGKVIVLMTVPGKTDQAEGTYEMLNARIEVTVRGDTLEFARKGNVLEGWKNGQVLLFAKQ